MVLLALYGLARSGGVVLAGRYLDARPVVVALASLGLVAAGTAAVWPSTGAVALTVGIVVWGAAFTAVPVVLLGAVLRVAGADALRASAASVVSFQIGISGGAWVGGLLLTRPGAGALPLVTTAAALVSAVVVGCFLRCSAVRVGPVEGSRPEGLSPHGVHGGQPLVSGPS